MTFSNQGSNEENGQIDNATKVNSEYRDGNRGAIYTNGDNRTVMHETGHFLGLPDRYDTIDDGWNPIYLETHKGFQNDLMNYPNPQITPNRLLDKIYYDQYIAKAKMFNPNVKIVKSYLEIGRNKSGYLLTPYEKGGVHAFNSYAR